MRIALVHSFYSSTQPSGENAVVRAQAEVLVDAGHDVHIVTAYTDELEKSAAYPARAAWRVATGKGASPSAELELLRPDVVHIHNLFPNFGHSWMEKWPGAIVQTLHNFRTVCAAGTLFRDGHACEECPTSGSLAAVQHRCYRGSAVSTAPLALATRGGGRHSTQLVRPERVVVLSERSRETISRLAGPELADRLRVVPNFAPPQAQTPTSEERDAWVYAGRLAPEKGIAQLLEAWPHELPLDVLGSGPDLDACRSASANKDIRLLGQVSPDAVPSHLGQSRGLVFPSKWAEGMPTIYLEALLAGVPTLALRGNAVADDVAASGTGIVIGSMEEAGSAAAAVELDREALSSSARRRHESAFLPSLWAASMEAIYGEALASRKAR